MFYFSKKVRLFSQNDVLFLFYFLINLTMTTAWDLGTYPLPPLDMVLGTYHSPDMEPGYLPPTTDI